ncbi:hypothetical protein [Arcobacter sp.]|uniref:hypothetical protein n=1 Tax=Arcobacter sp. TaxID=1872629 RepID=UPI003D117A19
MERNGILLAGKKIIKGLLVSSILLASAQADFLMTLTDKNGVEENLCVKSYSFSNNMESLHKEVKQMKDVYSTEETLTNKVFFSKPVYRRVFVFDDFQVPVNEEGVYKYTSVISPDIEEIVELSYKVYMGNKLYSENNSFYAIYGSSGQYFIKGEYDSDMKKGYVYLRNNLPLSTTWFMTKLKIFVEYTKTTDTAQTNTNELTTLVHYLPSDSINGEYITKSIDNAGIRFQKNYTYDASTNSCIALAN